MNSDFDILGFLNGFCRSAEEIAADLDDAWRKACIYGNFKSYEDRLRSIKVNGVKVFRNSQGKHKVKK